MGNLDSAAGQQLACSFCEPTEAEPKAALLAQYHKYSRVDATKRKCDAFH
jgi:hypothetical protein